MPAEDRSKSFHYKAARWLGGPSNLQKRLNKVLSTRKKIGERREPLDREGKNARFINGHRTSRGMLCGMVVVYTQGTNQLVITDDTADQELEIEQIAPPKAQSGKRREFVEGLLYFGIKDNHVFLVQSQVIQAKRFNEHLSWLFQLGVPSGQAPNLPLLQDKAPGDLKKKAIKGVKSITLKAPVGFEAQTQDATQLTNGTPQQELVVRRQADDQGSKLFQAALEVIGNEALSEQHSFKEAMETGDIDIELRIVRRKRSTVEHPSYALDDIAALLTDKEDANYILDVPNVGKVNGKALTIQNDFIVPCPGGWASPADVYNRMHEWMQALLSICEQISGCILRHEPREVCVCFERRSTAAA